VKISRRTLAEGFCDVEFRQHPTDRLEEFSQKYYVSVQKRLWRRVIKFTTREQNMYGLVLFSSITIYYNIPSCSSKKIQYLLLIIESVIRYC